jgi:hypothetical protein
LFGYKYTTNYDDAIKHVVKLITMCDLNKIEEIRDIFFNIWITNYEGVRIIRDIVRRLILSDKMNEECKINIIVKTSEIEYNLLRGRREVIHFDDFVVNIMKMIQDHNTNRDKKRGHGKVIKFE